MTVTSTDAFSGPYIGTGSTTAFPFFFKAQTTSEAYLEVDGEQVSATITLGSDGGGTATAAVAPIDGAIVYVRLNPSFQQNISLINGGAFSADVVEEGLDRAAERDIYLRDRIDTAILSQNEAVALTQAYANAAGLLVSGAAEYIYASKALADADFANIPVDALVKVVIDESKQNTFAIYQRTAFALHYLTSVATVSAVPPVSGVLFDTASTDNFTDLIYTPDATLTISDIQAAFSSASAVDKVMTIPADDGVTPLYFCFDHWTFDATFIVTSFPAAGAMGVQFGARYYAPGSADATWGAGIQSHGGSATQALVDLITGGSTLGFAGTGGTVNVPATLRIRASHNQTTSALTVIVNVNGGADITTTTAYGGGSFAGNTRMTSPVVRFNQGVLTLTDFKFSAAYPNASLAFLGDSLTVWPGAVAGSPSGFTHLIRADRVALTNPGVLIAGASGSTTLDWTGMVESVARMGPQTAFICLGTNDRVQGLTVAQSQAAMTTIITTLQEADTAVVLISSPPIGNSNVPIFNAWLQTLGLPYIDIYTPLLGTGVSLAAIFDSGDHIHWTDTGAASVNGHLTVKNIISAYIAAAGL